MAPSKQSCIARLVRVAQASQESTQVAYLSELGAAVKAWDSCDYRRVPIVQRPQLLAYVNNFGQ